MKEMDHQGIELRLSGYWALRDYELHAVPARVQISFNGMRNFSLKVQYIILNILL